MSIYDQTPDLPGELFDPSDDDTPTWVPPSITRIRVPYTREVWYPKTEEEESLTDLERATLAIENAYGFFISAIDGAIQVIIPPLTDGCPGIAEVCWEPYENSSPEEDE